MNKSPLRELLANVRVLPVLTIHQLEHAVPLVGALAEGGLRTVEITLRTPCALAAIRQVSEELPEVVVGAGTLVDPEQFEPTLAAGARFAVSPGLTAELAEASHGSGLPLLPGVATASEAMAARAVGFDFLKLFPAQAIGGRTLLRSLAGPLGELLFCPTGGIDDSSFRDYLQLPNVLCVGGSWMVSKDLVTANDWSALTASAASAHSQATAEDSAP